MRFTWHYWRRRPLAGLICLFFAITAVGVDTFVPVMTGGIVNSMTSVIQGVSMQQALSQSWGYFAGFAAASLSYHILYSAAIFCWNWFAARTLYDIIVEDFYIWMLHG